MDTLLALNTATAGLGLSLLAILFRFLWRHSRRGTLRPFRSPAQSADEKYGYLRCVDDGVVLGKDGSLLAAWRYRGRDGTTMSPAQQAQQASLLNQAFRRLGNGWILNTDVVNEQAPTYPASTFPDSISARIDEERRAYFARKGAGYHSYKVMTLSYLPPISLDGKSRRLVFGKDAPELAAFKDRIALFEDELPLSMARLQRQTMTRADGTSFETDELLQFLHRCITGDDHAIHIPPGVNDCDQLIGGRDLTHGVPLVVGDKAVQVVAVEGFPVDHDRGLYEHLGEMLTGYRWSTRFIFLDEETSLGKLGKRRANWGLKAQKIRNVAAKTDPKHPDEDALDVVDDATMAISEVTSKQVGGGYYTSVIVIMDDDPDEALRQARYAKKVISELGLSDVRIEAHPTDAFLGSLPGHGVENVRKPWMNTQNLADLIPKDTIWTGEPNAPCPHYPPGSPPLMKCVAKGRRPYDLNLHVQDVGNTLIFGPPGAGKSTLLALLAAQFRRYPGARVHVFDKGMSMLPLCAAIHAATGGASGHHHTLSADHGELAFAPLQFLETRDDIAWTLNWLDSLMTLNGLSTTRTQRNMIGEALKNFRNRGARSLTDLAASIQDKAVQEVLHSYTSDGVCGHLFDAEQDSLADSDFTVFETEQLQQLDDRYSVPVMHYAFRRIERRFDGTPTMIIADEASDLFGNKVARELFISSLRTYRKKNCIVVMATQSTADASDTGAASFQKIKEFVASKIFLPNPEAASRGTAEVYESFGLSPQQIGTIASGTPKKHYYHATSLGQREFELAVGDFTMAFCGASDIESIREIQALQAQHGNGWIQHWLARRAPHLSAPARLAA